MITGVIDYGAGNQRSIRNALDALGVEHSTVASAADLEGIGALIFPGVGAFGDSMSNLDSRGLVSPIREWIAADRPSSASASGSSSCSRVARNPPARPGSAPSRARSSASQRITQRKSHTWGGTA